MWGSRGPKHLTICCFFFFFGIGLGHYTFAPVTRILFVCALLVVAAASKWELPSTGKPLSNPPLYKRLVGSLVYFTVSRPDISYAVHQVS